MTSGQRVTAEADRPRETVRTVTLCQGCDSAELRTVIDFGHQPPVHALLRRGQLDLPEVSYPLRLIRCVSCGLVQLSHVVDPRIVFPKEYPYLTSMTPVMRANFRQLAAEAKQRLGLGPGDLAVDIGSNDGTLLEGFQELGLRVLGVEPTDIAKIAVERGIPTLQRFFDRQLAQEIAAQYGRARIVTATNVIAHVDDIVDVLAAIRMLLTDDGVFVSESHYLLDLIEGLQYDTIYHEHLRYYSLRPFAALAQRAGLHVVDASRIRTHGGSIRVWAALRTDGARASELAALMRSEDEHGLYVEETYRHFRHRVVDQKQRLLELLLRLRREGVRVAGVGAPARAGTLINTCHLDPDVLEFIREQDGSLKVGLYMPLSHIPVVDERHFLAEQPEYAIILSWHIAEEVIASVRAKGYRGRFIMPLPDPVILKD